ncbi:MAG TPA: hypothetical protein VFL73_10575 [Solirubrobacteraceae bacterium]|nr:hypothetical protein [Solirubrobacteraceae bacterium]
MARLRHVQSGAVVNVSDEKAARMDAEWEPLGDEKKAQAKKPARKAAAKSDNES